MSKPEGEGVKKQDLHFHSHGIIKVSVHGMIQG